MPRPAQSCLCLVRRSRFNSPTFPRGRRSKSCFAALPDTWCSRATRLRLAHQRSTRFLSSRQRRVLLRQRRPRPRNPRRRNSRIDPMRTSISMSQRRILRGHLPAHSREVAHLRMPLRTRRRQRRMRRRHKMTLRRRRQEIRSVSSRVVRAQVRSMRRRRETCPTHNRPRVNGSFRSRARSSSVVQ